MAHVLVDETKYFSLASGGLTKVTGPAPVPTPPGATVLTEAQYNTQHASMLASNDAHWANVKSQEDAGMEADYNALIAAGIPAASAARLSGHNP